MTMYDILKDYNIPMPGEGPQYTMYYYQYKENKPEWSFGNLTWDNKYQYLIPQKDNLVAMFEDYYKFREIGQETEMRFHAFLQRRLNEISEDFNHRFKIYGSVDVDELGTGYTETEEYDHTKNTDSEASATGSQNSKFKDTPTSVAGINNPTTETDNTNEDSGTSSEDMTEHYTRTHDKTVHDDTMIAEANSLMTNYRVISMEFVRAFEPCFIQLLQ